MLLQVTLLQLTLLSIVCRASDEWVVKIPDGQADLVAKLHQLENLGEAVPESGYFHFRQNSEISRKKRSLRELTDEFEANPLVESYEAQLQSLRRQKRVPLPEPPLATETSVSAAGGNQLCFINTIATDNRESKRCIFPFSYSGKTYLDCTADHSSNGAVWCGTQVDADGEVINGEWGDCDKKAVTCLTIGAGTLGKSRPVVPAPPRQRPAAPQQTRPAPSRNQFPPLANRNQGPPRGFPPQGLPRRLPQQERRPPPPPPRTKIIQEQQCVTVNEAKPCVFPFSFRGKTYSKCTTDHSTNGIEWCATAINADTGEVINKQWGDCLCSSTSTTTTAAADNDQCLTVGGPNPGKPCVFPFVWNGQTFHGCDTDPEDPSKLWCSTRVDSAGNHITGEDEFGFCGIGCPRQPKRPQAPPPASPPRGFPPQGLPQQARPQQGRPQQGRPQQGFLPQGFPRQGQGLPQGLPQGFPRQGQGLPQGLPPQGGGKPFKLDTNTLLAQLADQLAGGGSGSPDGNNLQFLQKPEESFPEVDRTRFKTYLNDEAWPSQWYLNRGGHGMDMNVEDAWDQGMTGKGVVVSILDDGVEWNHPDLKDNYDQEASIDLNDKDNDPFPRYDFINSNKHGTRCAGTVAAKANNSDCAVGIAHNARIGGVRILDGPILDVLEARAISYNRNHIDIYSASWGPDDDGKTVDGPGPLARLALAEGVKKGRNGKGNIYVWASGNGGKHSDNCNCDGYATSVYTLSVSSVSEEGHIPWYSEPCSSTLTTTYSSGSSKILGERKVVTTDLHGRCTTQHTGTSASSPMAAGIAALALEANPNLTWRDVQHIIVRTSIPEGNLHADDWATNAVGLEFSHSYGFGLMDAGAIVRMAKDWRLVPEPVKCTTEPGQSGITKNRPLLIKPGKEEFIPLDASSCGSVNFLEHIHLLIDLTSGAKRGDLAVILKSPEGTQSTLLGLRPKDLVRTGFGMFKDWPMMTVHFWGEPVVSQQNGGNWILVIYNNGDRPAILNDWQLVFYGTASHPQPNISVSEPPPIAPFTTFEPDLFVEVDTTEEDEFENGKQSDVLGDEATIVVQEAEILDDDDDDDENIEDTTPFEDNFEELTGTTAAQEIPEEEPFSVGTNRLLAQLADQLATTTVKTQTFDEELTDAASVTEKLEILNDRQQ